MPSSAGLLESSKDKMSSILKISIALALIGTFILLFLSYVSEPKLIEIKDISKAMLDNFVKISGKINSIDDKESIKIIKVEDDSGQIDVIVFEENIINIGKGMNVEIIGKVSEYQGKMQINAEKIRGIE